MSLLVHYTIKSAEDHDAQIGAMTALVANLRAEAVPVHYACYTTEDPLKFLGVLDFDDDAGFKAFQASTAFATYRETVGTILTGPPTTTRVSPIASTRN